MLRWERVTKIFKSDLFVAPFVALDNVSFDVPQGSMVGFLGANGAGKTTSIKIALDFIRPSSGNVIYGAELGKSKSEIFRNIGFLPERPYYYQHLKGREFIHFMGELSGLSRKQIADRIPALSKRFRIDHALERELKTYSKGMLQRIGFLVTVLHDPKMIILDEPLSGLDPVGRKEMKDIIIDIHREGRTVFFSSHIVSDVEETCQRVVFLRTGKLIYDGPVLPLLDAHAKPTWRICVPAQSAQNVTGVTRIQHVGGLDILEVASAQKDEVLRNLVTSGVSIVSLTQDKPHLEEIFYQTGKA